MKDTKGLEVFLGLLLVVFLIGFVVYIIRYGDHYLTQPATNGGEKWRLAYYEGGDYVDYAGGLRGLVHGLIELGWISELELPEFDNPDDTQLLWAFLATEVESNYLEFVPDAYWSAHWDDTLRLANREAAIDRLANGGDIDLVIAMGTWAGQDLANNQHAVPTLVLTASDPVAAGIIKSVADSGFDHVLAEVDPGRYRRQIKLFHDITGFKTLGVVFENTPEGRTYANLADLEYVAGQRHFEIITCRAQDANISELEALEGVVDCYKELAPQIDALWIGTHQGEHPKFMPQSLQPLLEHNVVIWAQVGTDAVERGALLSVTYPDYDAVGMWYAQNIALVFNGAQPGELDQVFELPYYVALNLETARRIGFEPPAGLLEIADQTFEIIQGE